MLTQYRRRHALVALVCVLPFLVGPLLRVDAEGASLGGWHAPACPARLIAPTWGCPGCGLTRSVALVLHGRIRQAVAVNAAGLVVILLAACGAILHGSLALRGSATVWHERLLRTGHSLFAVAVLTAWIVRM